MGVFQAKIEIIGVNPYILLPDNVLKSIFQKAGKDRGPIPVRGTVQGKSFKQTLVKYAGYWRLYLNTPMRQDSNTKVGDTAAFEVEYDQEPRIEPMNPLLEKAFKRDSEAKKKFDSLAPYRQKEILRYLNSIKSEEILEKNVDRVLTFLSGGTPDSLHPLLHIKD
jgi:hypothetical protein